MNLKNYFLESESPALFNLANLIFLGMGLYGAYELLYFENSFAEKVALYISSMIAWGFIFMQVFLKAIGFNNKK